MSRAKLSKVSRKPNLRVTCGANRPRRAWPVAGEALEPRMLMAASHLSADGVGELLPRINVFGHGQANADVITALGPDVEAPVNAFSFGAGPRQTIDISTSAAQVAVGDVNADGVGDVIIGLGPGTPPLVTVVNGLTRQPLGSFLAYAQGFTGGVHVGAGDVDGDGRADIITGAGAGAAGGHVKVFSGRDFAEIRSFFAYPGFAGGVFVSGGDVDGDGRAEILTGAGDGGGQVRLLTGDGQRQLTSFFAYGQQFTGGIRVAQADTDGDGSLDIITGTATDSTHVKAFSGRDFGEVRSFFAFPGFTGGVSVAAGDVNGDGHAEIITGAGPGAGPHVKVFDGATSEQLAGFLPYAEGFPSGVRVAVGDVDGDGRADIITGAGAGAPGGHVKVFDGNSFTPMQSFVPLLGFPGGVFVGSGDVNNDGRSDYITGADAGAPPHVKVFDGRTRQPTQFMAYPAAFTGGVRVASGDVNGDGFADVITGAGPGAAGGHVRVFSGVDFKAFDGPLGSFFAFPGFTGGVFVAGGDVNGDGFADVIVGAGAGGGPHIKAFDGRLGQELHSFFAFAPTFSGGVRVAAGDVNGDGRADVIVGAGPGAGPHVKVVDGTRLAQVGQDGVISDAALLASFDAFESSFTGGVFVAAGDLDGDGRAEIVAGGSAGAFAHVRTFTNRGQEVVGFNAYNQFGSRDDYGVRVAAGDVNGDRLADGDNTPDPSDGTDFGAVVQHRAELITFTYTVRNTGTAPLQLGPLTLPQGFELVEPLATTLNPNQSDTFTVRLATRSVGTFAGDVTIGNNDRSASPFNFRIRGVVTAPAVAARHVFYNNSYFDTPTAQNPGFNDDLAIARDKRALLPGQKAAFANYTSYNKGINGIMVDVGGLPPGASPTATDFRFAVGNDDTPGDWAPLSTLPAVDVRRGGGASGSDRITLTWADGSIRNRWLQVTVLATAETGLATPDVFYFGNAIGESGNSPQNATVTFADELGARAHSGGANVTSRWDYNRDHRVNLTDQLIARRNKTTAATDLKLILLDVPGSAALNLTRPAATVRGAPAMPRFVMPAASAAGQRATDDVAALLE